MTRFFLLFLVLRQPGLPSPEIVTKIEKIIKAGRVAEQGPATDS